VSLAVIFVVTQLRTLRRLDPLVVAIATMLGVEVVGVALGANFYLHYLIQVVPSLVLASGWLATTRARALWWGRVGIAAVLVSAVCFAVSAAIPPPRPPSETAAFETWIHAAAHPGDSLMITYGNANLFQASGLRPAYFNLWSLPMRVLDPNLEQLSATLAGPGAPTWMVEWDPFDMLGAGPAARLQAAVDRHFHQVADICGHQIFQLDGTRRALPAGVASCGS
jgi:hypothetical protein